jgi:DNA repair exonuclease SbcCD nuclease subunit
MDFTFLHASDLHLGSPFIGLALKDEDVARRFAAASREAFSALVTQAIESGVAFVLLAGDIYDGEWRDTSIGLFFNREVSRLHRENIPVYLLKGNHDAESVVTKTISLPESVIQFPTRKPTTFRIPELKVAIHGQSFPDRDVTENLALAYPGAEEGWFNIGVLHTACEGRPGHASYAPCSVQDLRSKGYQYWALGHVHEFEILSDDPWIVFPGNLQGRNVRECGPKGAVLVDVADGHVQEVRRLFVDHARWADVTVDVGGTADEAELLTLVQDALKPVVREAESRLLALRVRLVGQAAMHDHLLASRERLTEEVQAIGHHCHEDVWLERLVVETTPHEQHGEAADGDPSFDLAAQLGELQADGTFREVAAKIFPAIESRLPPGIGGDALSDLEALLNEAKSAVLERLTHRGA